MLTCLEEATYSEAAEDIIWKRLMEEVGSELIRYLMQRGRNGTDPLRDGVLVTVHRDYYDDPILPCRRFTLEARLWKVSL